LKSNAIAARHAQAYRSGYPPAAQHTDMEAGGIAEMSVMSEGSYAPPVHMIKLTEQRRITPYKWVHPDEER
jgi:hypothetical protein